MTPTTQAGATSASDPVTILYTNWRGETAVRRIIVPEVIGQPGFCMALRFGSTDWHPEPQWLLCATDADKDAAREFALSSIKAWGQEAVDAALASPAVVPESVRRLSEAATKGEWQLFDSSGVLEIQHGDGKSVVHWSGFDQAPGRQSKKRTNAGFIVEAVNWVRTLIADAPPSGRAAEGGESEAVWHWRKRAEVAEAQLAHQAALKSADGVRYQYREIGEGEGWIDCSREAYEGFVSDPHIDTRKIAPTPPASAGDVDEGPFRVGRKVPRNVYEGDRPLFMAASDEEAARLVTLLNGATAPAAPEPAAGGELLWHQPNETPEIGRRFVRLYEDGSGAKLCVRYDGGTLDCEGGEAWEHPEWRPGPWAYLPTDFRLWCEDHGDDPVTIPDRPPSAPARVNAGGETWDVELERLVSAEWPEGRSEGAAARELARSLAVAGAAPTLQRLLTNMLAAANRASSDRAAILFDFDNAAPEAAKTARLNSFERCNPRIFDPEDTPTRTDAGAEGRRA